MGKLQRQTILLLLELFRAIRGLDYFGFCQFAFPLSEKPSIQSESLFFHLSRDDIFSDITVCNSREKIEVFIARFIPLSPQHLFLCRISISEIKRPSLKRNCGSLFQSRPHRLGLYSISCGCLFCSSTRDR